MHILWWREEWTPDSITRLGWEVNDRSTHEDESVKILVGSLKNCCKPNWDVIHKLFNHVYTNLMI